MQETTSKKEHVSVPAEARIEHLGYPLYSQSDNFQKK